MSALILQFADEIVRTLNAAGLTPAFTAYRTYVPVKDIKDLTATVDVPVVAVNTISTQATRGSRSTVQYTLDIGVQTRLDASVTTIGNINVACDPLVLLVEAMGDLFVGKPVAAVSGSSCIAQAVTLLYIPKMLDEEKVFRSILSLTFMLGR